MTAAAAGSSAPVAAPPTTIGDQSRGLVLDPDYTGDGPTVAVYGDSLTVRATPVLRELFEGEGLSARITAVQGEGFGGGQWSSIMDPDGLIASTAEEDPVHRDVVVIALGTNDAWEELLSVEAALEGLDRIVGAVGDACIIAVEASEDSENESYDEDEARRINEAVRVAADRIIEFDLVAEHRSDDDVHLTSEGYEILARAMVAEAKACLGR